MELLSSNFYDTTTQIAVGSNTSTAQFLMSRDVRRQYVSEGFNSDLTTTTIKISFDETTTVDRIAMLGHNVKGMNIFYNGVTANAFALTGPTTTSQFASNSVTSLYLPCTPVACTSVTFDLKTTMVANSEKAVGFILLSEHEYSFPRIPAAGDFKPTLNPKELRHELSDGGVRTHVIAQKWKHKMKYKYLSATERDAMRVIYDQHEPKIFIPFETTTAWDGILYEANWTGIFDGYTYSDNAVASGFTININLEET